jgi:DNA gyrase subunit A
MVRTRVSEVPVLSRNTQGVRLIKLKTDETLVGVEPVADPEDEDLTGQDYPDSDPESSQEPVNGTGDTDHDGETDD